MADIEEIQYIKEKNYSYPLKYPLEGQDDYKGAVVFTVLKDEPVNLESLLDAGSNLASTLYEQAQEFSSGLADYITGKSREEVQADNQTHNGTSRGQQTTSGKIVPQPLKVNGVDKAVRLYLPVGLVYRDNVSYENAELGVAGGAALGSMRASGEISLGLKTSIDSLKGSAGSKQASLGTVRILEAVNDTAGAVGRAAAQVTVNPNARTLFKGVAIREFSFVFKFIPRSQREAQEVRRIIETFRTELYPESINLDTDANVSIGYEFPNKFQIDILYENKRIGTRILPAFLRDVNVTYNPSNPGMHSDGEFNEVDLSLSFTESHTLDKRLVRDEGY
jgi:hypothetical protein